MSKDEVVYDFLSENVGIGEIVGLFEAFVFEPSDVEDGRVSIDVMDSSFQRNDAKKPACPLYSHS